MVSLSVKTAPPLSRLSVYVPIVIKPGSKNMASLLVPFTAWRVVTSPWY